jgi:hypothetical protein
MKKKKKNRQPQKELREVDSNQSKQSTPNPNEGVPFIYFRMERRPMAKVCGWVEWVMADDSSTGSSFTFSAPDLLSVPFSFLL